MAASTFTQLISSPFRLTANDAWLSPLEETYTLHRQISNTSDLLIPPPSPYQPFTVADLPFELRQLIYTQYFASLPVQHISCSNVRLPHHSLTPLARSSPFLSHDAPPSLYYRHATFSFSCPDALKTFAKLLSNLPGEGEVRKDVRKIKILYGRYDQPSRDWVFLLTSNFPSLEEVTFSVDRAKGGLPVGHRCFGNWWGCVRDAVREGFAGRNAVLLKVEDGEWGMVEAVEVKQKA